MSKKSSYSKCGYPRQNARNNFDIDPRSGYACSDFTAESHGQYPTNILRYWFFRPQSILVASMETTIENDASSFAFLSGR